MLYQGVGACMILGAVLGAGVKFGIFSGIRDRVSNGIAKARLLSAILNGMNVGAVNGTAPTVFSINNTRKSASIKYTRYGKEYILNVPYDNQKMSSMIGLKVFLLTSDGEVEITQQPGLPYMLSARQLGGTLIKATREDEEPIIYSIDEVPLYCSSS